MNIAICDNEEFVLGIVSNAVDSIFKQKDISVSIKNFSSATALEKNMLFDTFDLIFLDIDMPNLDGITFAESLGKMEKRPDIIFVSNREDKVFEALKVHPFGFVRKSAFLSDISNVIESYIESKSHGTDDILSVTTNVGQTSININEIMYIESYQKLQFIYLDGEKEPVTIHSKMETIEEQLSKKGFFRIHKGYIVSYRYVMTITKDSVILKNKKELPISRGNIKLARSRYLEFLQENHSTIL